MTDEGRLEHYKLFASRFDVVGAMNSRFVAGGVDSIGMAVRKRSGRLPVLPDQLDRLSQHFDIPCFRP